MNFTRLFACSPIHLFTYSPIHLLLDFKKEVMRMAKLQLKFVDGVLAAIILLSMLSWWD